MRCLCWVSGKIMAQYRFKCAFDTIKLQNELRTRGAISRYEINKRRSKTFLEKHVADDETELGGMWVVSFAFAHNIHFSPSISLFHPVYYRRRICDVRVFDVSHVGDLCVVLIAHIICWIGSKPSIHILLSNISTWFCIQLLCPISTLLIYLSCMLC